MIEYYYLNKTYMDSESKVWFQIEVIKSKQFSFLSSSFVFFNMFMCVRVSLLKALHNI